MDSRLSEFYVGCKFLNILYKDDNNYGIITDITGGHIIYEWHCSSTGKITPNCFIPLSAVLSDGNIISIDLEDHL